jgi:hypothetical protein
LFESSRQSCAFRDDDRCVYGGGDGGGHACGCLNGDGDDDEGDCNFESRPVVEIGDSGTRLWPRTPLLILKYSGGHLSFF